eukprot:scaffold925_cov133-Isochrysis_galbana.AAC.5
MARATSTAAPAPSALNARTTSVDNFMAALCGCARAGAMINGVVFTCLSLFGEPRVLLVVRASRCDCDMTCDWRAYRRMRGTRANAGGMEAPAAVLSPSSP